MSDILKVNLGDRSYPIVFADDLTVQVRAITNELVFGGRKIAVVTDENVAVVHANALRALFGEAPVLTLPAGEGSKSVHEFSRALDFLASCGLDRSGAVFAVGGGVVGDLRDSRRPRICAGSAFSRCPRRFWRWSTAR